MGKRREERLVNLFRQNASGCAVVADSGQKETVTSPLIALALLFISYCATDLSAQELCIQQEKRRKERLAEPKTLTALRGIWWKG
jgi:hypothetical protein